MKKNSTHIVKSDKVVTNWKQSFKMEPVHMNYIKKIAWSETHTVSLSRWHKSLIKWQVGSSELSKLSVIRKS